MWCCKINSVVDKHVSQWKESEHTKGKAQNLDKAYKCLLVIIERIIYITSLLTDNTDLCRQPMDYVYPITAGLVLETSRLLAPKRQKTKNARWHRFNISTQVMFWINDTQSISCLICFLFFFVLSKANIKFSRAVDANTILVQYVIQGKHRGCLCVNSWLPLLFEKRYQIASRTSKL